MSLKCSNGILTDLSNIEVKTRGNSCEYQTQFYHGKWYLEYQHVKGDNKYVIGYRSNYGSISITPNGEESLYAYIIGGEDFKFNNEATTDEGTKYKLDIGYSKNSRVGVAN